MTIKVVPAIIYNLKLYLSTNNQCNLQQMEKLFDETPAPYPMSSVLESNAIFTLQFIIDTRRIKLDIKTLDKIPNSYGIIEVVNDAQIPIGKIDAQIKILEQKKTIKHLNINAVKTSLPIVKRAFFQFYL